MEVATKHCICSENQLKREMKSHNIISVRDTVKGKVLLKMQKWLSIGLRNLQTKVMLQGSGC